MLSLTVSVLYLAEIYISHSIIKEQHFLIDQHEIADSGPYYKQGWQKLAVEVWKSSQQDPSLLDYLKSEGVGVHEGPPPGSTPADSTNAAPPAPAPAAAAAPVATPAPAAPAPQPATP